MITSQDVRGMYLDLLRTHLTRFGDDDFAPIRAANHPVIRRIFSTLAKRNIRIMRMVPFDRGQAGP